MGIPNLALPPRWERLESPLWGSSAANTPANSRPGTAAGSRPGTAGGRWLARPSTAESRPRTAASARGLALSARASADAARASADAATATAAALMRRPTPGNFPPSRPTTASRPATAAEATVPPTLIAQALSDAAVKEFLRSLRRFEENEDELLGKDVEQAEDQEPADHEEPQLEVSPDFLAEFHPGSVASFLEGLLGVGGGGSGPSASAFSDGEAASASRRAVEDDLDRRLAWAPRPMQIGVARAAEPRDKNSREVESDMATRATSSADGAAHGQGASTEEQSPATPFFTRRKPLQRVTLEFSAPREGDCGLESTGTSASSTARALEAAPSLESSRRPLRRINFGAAQPGLAEESPFVSAVGSSFSAPSSARCQAGRHHVEVGGPSLTNRVPLQRVSAPAVRPASATALVEPSPSAGNVAAAPEDALRPPISGRARELEEARPSSVLAEEARRRSSADQELEDLLEETAEEEPAAAWSTEKFADPTLPAGALARLARGGAPAAPRRGGGSSGSRRTEAAAEPETALALDIGLGLCKSSSSLRGPAVSEAGSTRSSLRSTTSLSSLAGTRNSRREDTASVAPQHPSRLRLPRLQPDEVTKVPAEKVALARSCYRSSFQRQLIARRPPPSSSLSPPTPLAAERSLPAAERSPGSPSFLPPIQSGGAMEKIPWAAVAAASGSKSLLRRTLSERDRLGAGGCSPPEVFWAEGTRRGALARSGTATRGMLVSRSVGALA